MNRIVSLWLGCLVGVGLLASAAPVNAESGQDFIDQARLFYRVVACGEGEVPKGVSRAVVKTHCRWQKPQVEAFRKSFVARAAPFFAKHRPADLPARVVYPFGGGDLASALVTYPDATEITTISLEHAGDPRRLLELPANRLQSRLAVFRKAITGLLRNHDSASTKLQMLERGPLPGQLAFFIQALVALDYEPVSLKFFRIEDDGSLHYYTASEIDALENKTAARKAASWVDTDYSIAFSNSELTFRRRGAVDAPVKVHRHIAANLNDDRFPDSPLAKHLEAKGKVAAMTKAASYLLWSSYFSGIRNYLLANMVFMISDSTGIPPQFAARAGFQQTTFGRFSDAFLDGAPDNHEAAFRALWKAQPFRPLRFRYGYWDKNKQFHLLLTRRKSSG